jgi:hypothetical protein
VSNAADDAGLADVCVFAGTTTDNADCLTSSAAHGFFASDPIAAGQYIVLFMGDSTHALRYYFDKNDPGSANKVTVTNGAAINDVNQKLPIAAKITGKVTDAATNAAPTNKVCVGDYGGDVATFVSSFAGTDGTFVLDQLPPGPHKVRFFDCSDATTKYVEQFFNAKPNASTADPITLTAAQQQAGINANMSTTGIPTPASTSTSTSTSTTTSTTAPTSSSTTVPTSSASSTTTTLSTATTATTTVSAAATTTTTTAAPASTGTAGLSSSSAAPGGTLTVTGDGFAPGSTGQIFVFSTPVKIGEGVANAAGRITVVVQLPADLVPGAHTIQLQGIDPQGRARVVSSPIIVAGTGILRVTGAPTGELFAMGVFALGVGFALVLVARRRRGTGPYGLPY